MWMTLLWADTGQIPGACWSNRMPSKHPTFSARFPLLALHSVWLWPLPLVWGILFIPVT